MKAKQLLLFEGKSARVLHRTRPFFLTLLLCALCFLPATAQNTVTIGNTSGSNNYTYGPIYRSSAASTFDYSRYAYIYTDDELGIPTGSLITNIEWLRANGETLTGSNTFSIWLDNTPSTTLVTATPWSSLVTTATQVYTSTTQQFSGGTDTWESYALGPFIYTGGSLLVLTDHEKNGTASGAIRYYYTAATGKAIGHASGTAPTNSTNLSTATYGNNRPTIRITYALGTPCSGTPSVPVASASVATTCAGTPFALSATGLPIASGVTYQWQSRLTGSGVAFSDISGATSANYTITNQTAATDYQLVVTCTEPGGGSVISNVVSVGQNPVYACYCTTGLGGASTPSINLITIPGTTLNNSTPGTAPGFYTAYPATGSTTATLTQGLTYSIEATYGSTAIGSMWIDYNQNGIFEASEHTQINTTGTNGVASFTVPIAAVAGQTGMRIRSRGSGNANGPGDACANFGGGETEDYIITIATATPCTGTPVATIASSATGVCTDEPFTLSAAPSGMSGITYLFQSSANGTTWNNLGTVALTNFYTVSSQSVTTQYRVIITCDAGGSDTSTPVTVAQNPAAACYCAPIYTTGCSSNDRITNFVLGAISNNSGTACGTSPLGYSDYTSMSTVLMAGSTNTATISIGSGGAAGVAIWIDYNDNGIFEDSEKYNTTSTISASGTGTVTIAVPASANPGVHRMRARLVWNNSGVSIDPCSSYTWGEVEDYTVDIVVPAACTGTPAAGITSSISAVCSDVPFTLTASPIGMSGLSYQFQSSTNGGASWDALGASSTTNTYTIPSLMATTQYRVLVTCAGGSTGTSSAITVTQNSPTLCYCVTGLGGSTSPVIDTLKIVGTTLDHATPGAAPGFYTAYPATGNTTATLTQGVTYTIRATYSTSAIGSVWIDYNQNGTFEASEHTQINTTGTSGTASFTVPVTALSGQTGMRVRSRSSGSPNGPGDACLNMATGETQDYVITIAAAAPCSGIPAGGTVSASVDTLCPGNGTTLSVAGYSTGVSGITIQWQQSNIETGPFTDVTTGVGSTTDEYETGDLTTTTYYLAKVTCASSGLSGYSDTFAVVVEHVAVVGTTPGSSCTAGPVTLSATGTPGSTLYWWDAPTDGTELGTGATFVTPSISATTTYYVSASTGSTLISAGQPNPQATSTGFNGSDYGLQFNATQPFVIQSVDVYPTAGAGTITIALEDASGTVLQTSGPLSFTAGTGTTYGGGATPVTLMLNFDVPVGTGLRLVASSVSANIIRDNPISGWSYPLPIGNVGEMTAGILGGSPSSATYYFFYNWKIGSGCESERVPVVATIGGVPTITVQPVGDTVCVGQALTLSVGATGAGTYQWYGPMGEITGATSATYTIPSVSLAAAGDYSVQVIGLPGCGNATSGLAHVSVGESGQWMGFTSDWNEAANWCGGTPTATTDAIIPPGNTVAFQPIIQTANTGQVRNLSVMSSTLTVNGTLQLYGNLSAAAGGALDAANGHVSLGGTAAQNIAVGFSAQNLSVSGGGGKNLSNDVIVTGALALNSGILNLGATTLTLWPGATVSGGSAASYVRTGASGGLKQQVGATAASFPVGSSAYNPALITNNGTVDNLTVRVRDEVLSNGYSGAPVAAPTYAVKRTWDIEEENAGGSDATLTLQWNSGEENSSGFDYNHVYIAHYINGGWENLCCADAAMAPGAVGSGPYTVTQSNVSSFSPFTVGSAGGTPLHVPAATVGGFRMVAYPNPVSEMLTVKVEGGKEGAQVRLTDVTGRELMARYVELGKAIFELHGLSAGVYFVKYSDGVSVQTVKVNKQ